MLLELLRPLSFFVSMLSLYPIMLKAFFVPGTRWEERLVMALLRMVFAACICFASGILYARSAPGVSHGRSGSGEALLSTLPVRLFLCATGGMTLLFALSWWLEAYYVPLLHQGYWRP
ncbi:MAG TPA: hypothetical protein VGG56_13670 [Terracidiphilus sp.]|jgi:hypothetical protein